MPADRGPPALAGLLAEIEAGRLTDATRSTLRRALVAAADGRPIAEILNADGRARRDAALIEMRDRHFSGLSVNGAAVAMARVLRRHRVGSWLADRAAGIEPPVGTLRHAAHAVLLACDDPPSARTISRVLPPSPGAVAKRVVARDIMDTSR